MEKKDVSIDIENPELSSFSDIERGDEKILKRIKRIVEKAKERRK